MNKPSKIERRHSPLRDLSYLIARLWKRLQPAAIRRSSIHSTSKVGPGSQVVYSSFDRHSYCGYDCTFLNTKVGSFCSIADDVAIGGSNHPMHFVSTSPVFLSHRDSVKAKFATFDYLDLPETRSGNDVWIGRGASIRAGVEIGHGAVIAMSSVVTKNVEPYAIVGGNPAKTIRMRFDPEIVQQLLATRWWELPDEDLMRWGSYFNDPERFLSEWGKQ